MQTPRKSRMDKGLARLTSRDRWLLSWIGEQYVVRIDMLRVLISRTPDASAGSTEAPTTGVVTQRNVRRIIKRWQEADLVKYQKFLYDEPGVVWLTGKGLSSVGLEYRSYTPRGRSMTL